MTMVWRAALWAVGGLILAMAFAGWALALVPHTAAAALVPVQKFLANRIQAVR
jgi:hypothetical protein